MAFNETFNVLVLIDYDNLRADQKLSGILDIANKSLLNLPKSISAPNATCEVRVYGGWYEGVSMTHLAQKIAIELQQDFPSIIRVPLSESKILNIRVSAELAVALSQEPSHHLFNTFRKKSIPNNIRFSKPTDVGCENQTCILHLAKKLFQNNKCPVEACSVDNRELVYRHEQKIVDTMLTCDLIYASHNNNYSYIMLISNDDDFLPPIRTAILNGSYVYRLHPKSRQQSTSQSVVGSRLIELEL